MENEVYGIELDLITTKFDKKIKSIAQQVSNLSKNIQKQFSSALDLNIKNGNSINKLNQEVKTAVNDINKNISKVKKVELQVDKSKIEEGFKSTKPIVINEGNLGIKYELGDEKKIQEAYSQYEKDYAKSVEETKQATIQLNTELERRKQLQDIIAKSREVGATRRAEGREIVKTPYSEVEELPTKKIDFGLENIKSKFKVVSGNIGLFVDGIKSGFTKLGGSIKDFGGKSNITLDKFKSKTNKTFNGVNKSIKSGIRSIKRFTLGLIGIRSVGTILTRAYSSLMSMDKELSDSFQNSWRTLGALLAPAIEKIAQLFAYATTAVAKFVQALTGIDLVARANTKALKSQAKAMKSVAGFDEINNLAEQQDNTIKLQDIDTSGMDDFIDKIKNGDWFEIGKQLGEKINKMFEGINWNKIQSNFSNGAKNIALAINGLFTGINWNLIGTTLGESLNTLIETLYSFFDTIDASKIATSLTTGINTAINTINWVKLAQTISKGVMKIFDFMGKFIANIDWAELGRKVYTFLTHIDWGGVFSKFSYFIGAELAVVPSLLYGFISSAVQDIGKYFSGKMQEQGGNVIKGLYVGIVDAIKGIGKWIDENIFRPFITGFMNAFGIHSPSTVMKEQGKYIIEGLKEGLKGIWDSIKNIFIELPDKIKGAIKSIPDKFKEVFSGIKEKIKEPLNAVTDFTEKTINNITDGLNKTVKNIANSKIGQSVSNALSGAKSFVGNVVSSIKLPKLAVGTNYVPRDDMTAVLHKGEAVVPKKYNPALGGNNNEETNMLLQQVISAINDIEINPYTTIKDVGQANRLYNDKISRMTGGVA